MKPNKRTTVATLLATGTSQREIARLTRVDRKTIRRLALDRTGPEPNSPTLATGLAAANSSTLATGHGVENPPPRPPAIDSGPQSLCEPHRILAQAGDIGDATLALCQQWFEHEGRVGQRKLSGVVGLTKRFPRRHRTGLRPGLAGERTQLQVDQEPH